jgi:hypothetical protein
MSTIPSHEQIELRAYEIFLERGGQDGHDLEDWVAAERELNGRKAEIEAVYKQEEPEVETEKAIYAVASSSRSR